MKGGKHYRQFCKEEVVPNAVHIKGFNKYLRLCPICGGKTSPYTKKRTGDMSAEGATQIRRIKG